MLTGNEIGNVRQKVMSSNKVVKPSHHRNKLQRNRLKDSESKSDEM